MLVYLLGNKPYHTLLKTMQRSFFPIPQSVASAVQRLADAGVESRGAVYTRGEVVDFILDLIGYTTSNNLVDARLLEPSFGRGDFLIPAVKRLLLSSKRLNRGKVPNPTLINNSVRAVELHKKSFDQTRQDIYKILIANKYSREQANTLLKSWLIQGDYLLNDFNQSFTHIVGNPPYIRQEMIPAALMAEYRRRYQTIFDRADIYIPFIEYSLKLLSKGGVLGVICSDRWMKNRYGTSLRRLIAEKYHLKTYIDMVTTKAFLSDVIAYPAITLIANEPGGYTSIAQRPDMNPADLNALVELLADQTQTISNKKIRITRIGSSDKPWVLDDSAELSLVRRLERDFPSLEDAGCKVGIGVATGADDVYIGPFDKLDVESARKLKLVMTSDIQSGVIKWHNNGVINPFDRSGKVVDLSRYPKLRKYLESHSSAIKRRHVSKKNPTAWYRTIDRINVELVKKPKLLIPDIKGGAQVVYDSGRYYPHHNLYYIISDEWDLLALQAILLSGIANVFIEAYSTRMRGDYLRYQAQYLRRIRIPHWRKIPDHLREALRKSMINSDPIARDKAVSTLYGLSKEERATLNLH